MRVFLAPAYMAGWGLGTAVGALDVAAGWLIHLKWGKPFTD